MPEFHFHPPHFIAAVEINIGARFAANLAATVGALTQPPTDRHLKAMQVLLQDLESIRTGRGPTDQDLALAPQLTEWRFLLSPDGLRLTGTVVGHPVLGARDRIATSPVYAIDSKQHTWARSWNRFYLLGAPCIRNYTRERNPKFH